MSKLSNTGYRCLIIKNKILHSMYKENPNLDGLILQDKILKTLSLQMVMLI